ncbi:MAG: VCBS repeat-containing protein, partial [Planctomycetota bacterium]
GEQPALFTGFGASTSLLAGKRPKSVCPADVDQDGDPDLLVLNEGDPLAGEGGSLTSYATTTPQNLTASGAPVVFARQPEVPLGLGPAQEAVADMDRDGAPDLVVALAGSATTSGQIVLLRNAAAQTDAFSFAQPVTLVSDIQALAVQAVDLDYDGDPDLPIIAGNIPTSGAQTQVYENLHRPGDAQVSAALAQTLTANQQPSLLLTADEDQDGDVDVLALGTEIVDPGVAPMQTVVATHPNASFHPADIDRSGSVGPGDLFLLLGSWGADCSLTPCAADVDGDGGVGPSDLFFLLGSWRFVTG